MSGSGENIAGVLTKLTALCIGATLANRFIFDQGTISEDGNSMKSKDDDETKNITEKEDENLPNYLEEEDESQQQQQQGNVETKLKTTTIASVGCAEEYTEEGVIEKPVIADAFSVESQEIVTEISNDNTITKTTVVNKIAIKVSKSDLDKTNNESMVTNAISKETQKQANDDVIKYIEMGKSEESENVTDNGKKIQCKSNMPDAESEIDKSQEGKVKANKEKIDLEVFKDKTKITDVKFIDSIDESDDESLGSDNWKSSSTTISIADSRSSSFSSTCDVCIARQRHIDNGNDKTNFRESETTPVNDEGTKIGEGSNSNIDKTEVNCISENQYDKVSMSNQLSDVQDNAFKKDVKTNYSFEQNAQSSSPVSETSTQKNMDLMTNTQESNMEIDPGHNISDNDVKPSKEKHVKIKLPEITENIDESESKNLEQEPLGKNNGNIKQNDDVKVDNVLDKEFSEISASLSKEKETSNAKDDIGSVSDVGVVDNVDKMSDKEKEDILENEIVDISSSVLEELPEDTDQRNPDSEKKRFHLKKEEENIIDETIITDEDLNNDISDISVSVLRKMSTSDSLIPTIQQAVDKNDINSEIIEEETIEDLNEEINNISVAVLEEISSPTITKPPDEIPEVTEDVETNKVGENPVTKIEKSNEVSLNSTNQNNDQKEASPSASKIPETTSSDLESVQSKEVKPHSALHVSSDAKPHHAVNNATVHFKSLNPDLVDKKPLPQSPWPGKRSSNDEDDAVVDLDKGGISENDNDVFNKKINVPVQIHALNDSEPPTNNPETCTETGLESTLLSEGSVNNKSEIKPENAAVHFNILNPVVPDKKMLPQSPWPGKRFEATQKNVTDKPVCKTEEVENEKDEGIQIVVKTGHPNEEQEKSSKDKTKRTDLVPNVGETKPTTNGSKENKNTVKISSNLDTKQEKAKTTKTTATGISKETKKSEPRILLCTSDGEKRAKGTKALVGAKLKYIEDKTGGALIIEILSLRGFIDPNKKRKMFIFFKAQLISDGGEKSYRGKSPVREISQPSVVWDSNNVATVQRFPSAVLQTGTLLITAHSTGSFSSGRQLARIYLNMKKQRKFEKEDGVFTIGNYLNDNKGVCLETKLNMITS